MAKRTKLIILTSDESLIRQFSLNKTKNKHVIDLDKKKQVAMNNKVNHDIINLSLLAEFSDLFILNTLRRKIM